MEFYCLKSILHVTIAPNYFLSGFSRSVENQHYRQHTDPIKQGFAFHTMQILRENTPGNNPVES